MRGCHAKTMPRALQDHLAMESADWSPTYPFPGDVRQAVVEALHEAQRGLCVYCGRRLDMRDPGSSYHIEHFRPQGRYPTLATDFANLFLSCGQRTPEGDPSETCGMAKGDRFDEAAHIQPDYPACAERFRFLLDGEVVAEADGDRAATRTIEHLNLNHPDLQRLRARLLALIDDGSLELSDFIDPAGGPAQGYAHVACRHLGARIP